MNVTKVTGSSSIINKSQKNVIDNDFFMNLLVAQLRYQDPLSPVDNNQFMTQTAQFATLEALQSLGNDFSQSKAYSLLGKCVTAQKVNIVTGLPELMEGIVDSIIISGDEILLNVGEEILSPDSVIGVRNQEKDID